MSLNGVRSGGWRASFSPARSALAIAVAIACVSAADAAAHDMLAQAPQRNPFDLGMREGGGPPPAQGFAAWVLSQQIRFERMLSGAVRAINTDTAALWTLLGISFAYGVFHAAGPGHGKAVVASYMLANERSLRRGLVISLLAAILQGVVAVLIVGILAAALNATSAHMRQAANLVEIASYTGIALLGVWLIWRKGRGLVAALGLRAGDAYATAGAAPHVVSSHVASSHVSSSHASSSHVAAPHVHDAHCGHFHAPSPDMLGDKNFSWRTAILTVFAAGARPCSGAILVLVFALAQGIFVAGVAATFAMSIGTAMTTGALASIAVLAKGLAVRFLGDGSERGVLAVRALELTAAILVFMLGASLLMGALAGGASGA